MENEVKRTYILPEQLDMEIKMKAVRDRVHPSDIIRLAVEQYLGLDKKDKKK